MEILVKNCIMRTFLTCPIHRHTIYCNFTCLSQQSSLIRYQGSSTRDKAQDQAGRQMPMEDQPCHLHRLDISMDSQRPRMMKTEISLLQEVCRYRAHCAAHHSKDHYSHATTCKSSDCVDSSINLLKLQPMFLKLLNTAHCGWETLIYAVIIRFQ